MYLWLIVLADPWANSIGIASALTMSISVRNIKNRWLGKFEKPCGLRLPRAWS